MAKSTLNLFLFLLLSLLAIALSGAQVNALGRKVGGRTEIEDVKTNKEVQQLGRYCVEEYNKGLKQKKQGTGRLLSFSEVVKAEKQVVNGIKYYLRISASTASGEANTFDAVVVVKPWAKSKELLSFAPATPSK
nr:cysteine proteinase inhibitor B-like [Ipomoea batatas]